jgi:hypothetical protein
VRRTTRQFGSCQTRTVLSSHAEASSLPSEEAVTTLNCRSDRGEVPTGFETLVRDGVYDKAARALGAALGWDKPSVNMRLEDYLFVLVMIARKKPLAGRG